MRLPCYYHFLCEHFYQFYLMLNMPSHSMNFNLCVFQIYLAVSAVICVTPNAIHGYLYENCNFIIPLSENEGTSIVNPGGYLSLLGYIGYYGYFKPGSSCRYFVQAPPNYVVKIICDIDIAITVSSIACIAETRGNVRIILHCFVTFTGLVQYMRNRTISCVG